MLRSSGLLKSSIHPAAFLPFATASTVHSETTQSALAGHRYSGTVSRVRPLTLTKRVRDVLIRDCDFDPSRPVDCCLLESAQPFRAAEIRDSIQAFQDEMLLVDGEHRPEFSRLVSLANEALKVLRRAAQSEVTESSAESRSAYNERVIAVRDSLFEPYRSAATGKFSSPAWFWELLMSLPPVGAIRSIYKKSNREDGSDESWQVVMSRRQLGGYKPVTKSFSVARFGALSHELAKAVGAYIECESFYCDGLGGREPVQTALAWVLSLLDSCPGKSSFSKRRDHDSSSTASCARLRSTVFSNCGPLGKSPSVDMLVALTDRPDNFSPFGDLDSELHEALQSFAAMERRLLRGRMSVDSATHVATMVLSVVEEARQAAVNGVSSHSVGLVGVLRDRLLDEWGPSDREGVEWLRAFLNGVGRVKTTCAVTRMDGSYHLRALSRNDDSEISRYFPESIFGSRAEQLCFSVRDLLDAELLWLAGKTPLVVVHDLIGRLVTLLPKDNRGFLHMEASDIESAMNNINKRAVDDSSDPSPKRARL